MICCALQKINQPHQHRVDFMHVSHHEVGDRIDDHDLGIVVLDELMDLQEMHFQPALRWAPCLESQKPFLRVLARSIPIERMLRAACAGDSSNATYRHFLPVGAGRLARMRAEARFSRSGGAANQNRSALCRSPCLRASRRDRGRPWRCARWRLDGSAAWKCWAEPKNPCRRSGTDIRRRHARCHGTFTMRRRRVETWSVTR